MAKKQAIMRSQPDSAKKEDTLHILLLKFHTTNGEGFVNDVRGPSNVG